jgi:hypothetical protein
MNADELMVTIMKLIEEAKKRKEKADKKDE